MFYKFNKETLSYEKVNWVKPLIQSLSTFIGFTIILITMVGLDDVVKSDGYSETEVLLIMNEQNSFTPEKLEKEINIRNYKFPHIVYAQAILESGNFNSKIFIENNNLFGMKQASTRLNTALGEQHGHAYYLSWQKSLEDYGYYYSSYLRQLNTEEQYFSYLSQNYAEDPSYVSKIKNIIERENLKDKFNIN